MTKLKPVATLAIRPGHTEKWVREFVCGYGTVCLTDIAQEVKMPTVDYVLSFHGAFRYRADIYKEEVARLAERGITNATWCKGVAVAKTILLSKRGKR